MVFCANKIQSLWDLLPRSCYGRARNKKKEETVFKTDPLTINLKISVDNDVDTWKLLIQCTRMARQPELSTHTYDIWYMYKYMIDHSICFKSCNIYVSCTSVVWCIFISLWHDYLRDKPGPFWVRTKSHRKYETETNSALTTEHWWQ